MIQSKFYQLFVTIITAILVLGVIGGPVSAASQFVDVSEKYKDAVDYLVDNQITEGYSETEFGTYYTIKRIDAAILLTKALKLEIKSNAKSGFTDVPERGEPYIAALRNAGVVHGKTETTFASYDNITRGEMALILAKGFKLQAPEGTTLPFVDVSKVYYEAISALLHHKVTFGKTATTFGTWDNLTRGEFALFLHRISKIEEAKNTDDYTIGLDVLDKGLLDGTIAVEKLVNNPDLLRVTLLNENLAVGDVVKVVNDQLPLVIHALTSADINRGYVDFGLGKELLSKVKGGEALNLEGTVERSGDLLGKVVKTIKLPIFPLVKPVIDKAGYTVESLSYILRGEVPLKVTITAKGLEQVGAGNTLKLLIKGTNNNTETIVNTITQTDIDRGYVEYLFKDSNLIERILKGAITGSKITITPEITNGTSTSTGESVIYEVTNGLLGSILGLEVLDNGLLNGSLPIEKLTSGQNLLRVTLSEIGVVAEDVIKVGYDKVNLLTHTLTEADIEKGFVDFGLSDNLLGTLKGGETLNLVGTLERGGSIVGSVLETIKLPAFPLVEPVIDLAKNTVGDLSYILAGEVPLRVDVNKEGLEQITPGNSLRLIMKSGSKTETVVKTITQTDIDRGYVEYYFTNSNLVERLLQGLTTGSTITITPEILNGEYTSTGTAVTYTVTSGLLKSLVDVVGGVLGGLLGLL